MHATRVAQQDQLTLAPAQVAARVQALCPPRGGIRLLAADVTHGGRRALDYLIAQQLILDTVHYFDGDRLACARRLAHGESHEQAGLTWSACLFPQ